MAIKGEFEKIIVPFDGSKFSQKALEIAMAISKKFGSSLYLITIIDVSGVSPPGALLGSQKKTMAKSLDIVKSATRSKYEKILSEKAALCKKNGVDVHYEILDGVPSDMILKLIKKWNVDLVVIGSHGLSGFNKIMALGSVSRKISEIAGCPVLISH